MSNPSDKVYTPRHIAKEVLDIFAPMVGDGTVIEPFRGNGGTKRHDTEGGPASAGPLSGANGAPDGRHRRQHGGAMG